MSRLISQPQYHRCLRAHNIVQFLKDKRPNPRSQSSSCHRLLSTRSVSRSSQASEALSTTPIHPRHPYTFRIASSWAGKPSTGEDRATDDLPFPLESPIGRWREEMLDRSIGPRKKHRGKDWVEDAGEDFFFVQEMRNGSGVSFGLADGVGGWIENGVNPALFSQSLMYHAHRYSRNAWAGEPEIDPTLDYEEREQIEGWELTPYHCLDLALGGVLREKAVQAGSSTACLLTLNSSSGLLRSANLGDSGFSIIRSSNVIYKEKVQTHFFNCPKQLTKLPANPGRKFARVCIDSPKEANTHSIKLRDGDIVVAYTDGFSDNVFPSEMLSICTLAGRKDVTEDEQVQTMADNLVLYARQCMMDRRRVSPFEREAAREGMFFRGGKIDDVTVLVALVRETS
ncbi:phosphatase 2C-like domain-containing protein [Lentinula raphanica]|nr:phosphatase 2C-like domain-containing protein [Lentinula raphanica]